MQDLELPKKLTPANIKDNLPIEQQKKNLEQKDEEIEQPVEKDGLVLLSDVHEEIEKKTKVVEYTKTQITEARNRLGLPPSDEIPHSVKIEEEAITKLNQEKTNLETNAQKPKIHEESQENTIKFERNLRDILDDISTQSRIMLDALHERQQEQLTPLQSFDEFQGIVSHLRSIKNFEGKLDIDGLGSISEHIQKTSRLVGDMNPKNTSRGIRDTDKNLEKLAYGARAFSASLDEAGRKLGPELVDEKMEEKRKELRKSINVLSEQTQKLNSLASRMREKTR